MQLRVLVLTPHVRRRRRRRSALRSWRGSGRWSRRLLGRGSGCRRRGLLGDGRALWLHLGLLDERLCGGNSGALRASLGRWQLLLALVLVLVLVIFKILLLPFLVQLVQLVILLPLLPAHLLLLPLLLLRSALVRLTAIAAVFEDLCGSSIFQNLAAPAPPRRAIRSILRQPRDPSVDRAPAAPLVDDDCGAAACLRTVVGTAIGPLARPVALNLNHLHRILRAPMPTRAGDPLRAGLF
mmetsp:Transcript_18844/g.43280  ORF Transcript_18844/g.43280 Transcript_18844/m.43280 type:complete len:239 (+) Transcript_18844:1001-1717(+)